MIHTFTMELANIQPSQLFISSAKLSRIVRNFDHSEPKGLGPIPVKKLGDQIIFTDGHTRAFAAFLRNLPEIRVCWDEDELDWEAYAICVDWCKKEGIRTIADLQDRILAPKEYKVLWLQRCEEMQRDLAARRNRIGGKDG